MKQADFEKAPSTANPCFLPTLFSIPVGENLQIKPKMEGEFSSLTSSNPTKVNQPSSSTSIESD